jgi:hypothetical protein
MHPLVILVTGSRSLEQVGTVEQRERKRLARAFLTYFASRVPSDTLLIHGGAEGVDRLAELCFVEQAKQRRNALHVEVWKAQGSLEKKIYEGGDTQVVTSQWGTGSDPIVRNSAMVRRLTSLRKTTLCVSVAVKDSSTDSNGTMRTVRMLQQFNFEPRLLTITQNVLPSNILACDPLCTFLQDPAGGEACHFILRFLEEEKKDTWGPVALADLSKYVSRAVLARSPLAWHTGRDAAVMGYVRKLERDGLVAINDEGVLNFTSSAYSTFRQVELW